MSENLLNGWCVHGVSGGIRCEKCQGERGKMDKLQYAIKELLQWCQDGTFDAYNHGLLFVDAVKMVCIAAKDKKTNDDKNDSHE